MAAQALRDDFLMKGITTVREIVGNSGEWPERRNEGFLFLRGFIHPCGFIPYRRSR